LDRLVHINEIFKQIYIRNTNDEFINEKLRMTHIILFCFIFGYFNDINYLYQITLIYE